MPISKKQFWINFFAASIGNLFEYYDKALFAFLAPCIAPLFFDTASHITALIYTYAMIPIGLLSKPAGALLFGKIGDKKGRRAALSLTLTGMAITTILMGCLPTSHHIGWGAPVLLAMGRLSQSFFAAGEKAGGALLILETCNQKKRAFYNGLYDCSTILGIVCASLGVTWLTSHGDTLSYWRVLYWIGGLTGIVGIVMRRFTTELTQPSPTHTSPLSLFWRQRRAFLLVTFTSGFSSANYYMVTSLLNGYLPIVSPLSAAGAMQSNSLILVLDLLLLPMGGWLGTRFNKQSLLLFFATAICILAFPLYSWLPALSSAGILCVRLIFVLLGIGFSVILTPYYQDLIAPAHRYTLISFGNAIGSQLIGASACTISFILFHYTNWPAAPSLYLIISGILALVMLLILPPSKTPYNTTGKDHC